ncbi:hypothetical protein T01_6758 [Trichinella spiralis]|uniref:Uncharacterized protein n=1 Tax=Trichinella spiralis TaxID=6334 RepID=A0A0V1BKU6_TRISP|nr:hypothetical protein T01_6758 [Trichinella spiralis]
MSVNQPTTDKPPALCWRSQLTIHCPVVGAGRTGGHHHYTAFIIFRLYSLCPVSAPLLSLTDHRANYHIQSYDLSLGSERRKFFLQTNDKKALR